MYIVQKYNLFLNSIFQLFIHFGSSNLYTVCVLCTNKFFVGSHSPQPVNPVSHMGPILETALQRAPLLYIQSGKLASGVARYRYSNRFCI